MAEAIEDILELVALVELDNIRVHEERARRLSWSEEELANRDLPSSTSTFGLSRDELQLRFRFRVLFTDTDGEYTADIEAVYVLPAPQEVVMPVLQEFASRVAFMAVYPFIRASIFGSATRLGLPVPVLGIVRQGDMEAGQDLTDEETASAFLDNRSETLANGRP